MSRDHGTRPALQPGFYVDSEEGRWYLHDLDRRRFRRLGPLLRLASAFATAVTPKARSRLNSRMPVRARRAP